MFFGLYPITKHSIPLPDGTDYQLPDAVQQTGDPLEVFAYAGTVNPDLAVRVETEPFDAKD